MLITSPCKNCSEREPGCHTKCEKYKEFKRKDVTEKDLVSRTKRALYGIDSIRRR